MIRQRAFPARQIALLLLCLAGAATCPAQSTAGDTVYHLHGVVLDGLTGKPLARALVKSADQRLATLSGSDGKFAIDVSVPSPPAGNAASRSFRGALILMAQKPGYLFQQNRSIAIALGDTVSSATVELRLMPAASVTGHVSSAATDSASGVRLTLLRHQVEDGHFFWTPVNAQTTNARGEFRFTNLEPGDYALVTSQWRGEQPPPPRGALSQQYPPTFFGDVRTLDSSPRLHLRYGDSTPTEIHLHLATFYPVTVPLASGLSTPQVNARIAGEENFSGYQMRYNRNDNTIEGLLPSGDYTLHISSALGPQQGYAQLPLHVDSTPVRTAAIALAPPAAIQVRVHTEFTNPTDSAYLERFSGSLGVSGSGRTPLRSPPLQILLRSEDSGGYVSNTRLTDDGNLIIENVQPGRYIVRAQPFRGYVASMTSGGIDLLDHPLTVNPSGAPDPIDITLRDDTAILTGTVNPGDAAMPQASYIVLLPTDDAARFTQTFAGTDGKFTVNNLPPGSYRILAFPGQAFQIAYRDPETMRHYDGKGATVTVTAGQSPQVDVPLLDETEEE